MKSSGVELIAAERRRQVEQEGWTPEHDDEHSDGELASGAVAYALEALQRVDRESRTTGGPIPSAWWPWEPESWKPGDDPTRNLVKAGALIAAEIDRLQRAEAKS